MSTTNLLATVFLCIAVAACSAQRSAEPPLPEPFGKLLPLHKKLGRPAPGDWLDQHS